ncbi:MAG: hypothetical protein AABW90_02120 [Nanoarchaeota archaeon]
MSKRNLSVFVFCIFSLLIISFVSAGVLFSELNSKYNLGDTIDLNVKADPFFSDRLLKVTLFCGGNPVIEFNNLPDEEGNVNIKLPLNFYTIQQANGNCYFSSSYSGETRQSDNFEISKRLIIKLSKDAFFANPGEGIVVSGTAARLNGNPVNGEVEISVPLLSFLQIEVNNESIQANATSNKSTITMDNTNETISTNETESTTQENQTVSYDAGKFYGKVVNGEFSVSFKLIEETPAGNYRLDVLIFEETNGIRTSEGIAMANLNVFQVLKSVDLALNNQNFDPGTILEVKPNLLDQTGINVRGEVSIIIRNENSKRFFEKIVSSNEILQYKIPANLTSGYYEIQASANEISSTKKFFVNEKAIASFELVNNTLTVTNIGNIPYRKDIEVELNGKPFIKSVNLGFGETQKFKLSGRGEYNIKISDGENEIFQEGIKLTGYAVKVNAVNEKFNFDPIIWIFVIIISAVVLLFLFRNFFKKRSLAYHYGDRELELREKEMSQTPEKQSIPALRGYEVEKFTDWKVKEPIRQADQALVLKGHKSNAAVLVLKIKNKIGRTEKQSLERAMEYVYDRKGAVYEQDNFIYIIFSPLMTLTNRNEVEAAKAAEKIIDILNEHNKKFREKIDFGTGITSGEIINRVENKKLKFTALGNFIVVGKRLASISDKQILVTRRAYEKGISEIKAEKVKTDAGEVYEVRSIVDHEKSKKFIEGFLERQKKGS